MVIFDPTAHAPPVVFLFIVRSPSSFLLLRPQVLKSSFTLLVLSSCSAHSSAPVTRSALLIQIQILLSRTRLFSPPGSSPRPPPLLDYCRGLAMWPPPPLSVLFAADKVTENPSQVSSLLCLEPSRVKARHDLAPTTFPTHFLSIFAVLRVCQAHCPIQLLVFPDRSSSPTSSPPTSHPLALPSHALPSQTCFIFFVLLLYDIHH